MGKHVTSNIAWACNQRNTQDSVFSLAQMTLCCTPLSNFWHFVEPNSRCMSIDILKIHLLNHLKLRLVWQKVGIYVTSCHTKSECAFSHLLKHRTLFQAITVYPRFNPCPSNKCPPPFQAPPPIFFSKRKLTK